MASCYSRSIAKAKGLVHSIGVSNFQVAHLRELMTADGTTPALNQMERHPYLQDGETFAFCGENGIAYEAWSPLGRGGCLDNAEFTIVDDKDRMHQIRAIAYAKMERPIAPAVKADNGKDYPSPMRARKAST